MTQRRGLGRGLDALLSSTAVPADRDDGSEDTLLSEIETRSVAANPEQPRADFDDAELTELADSIRVHGLLQPIVVERDGHGGYRLIAGERRLRAARLAGLATIPAVIRPATDSSRHALELALVENLQRTDLGALEEAAAFARLADAFGLTLETIGLRVGRSRSAVANAIRLLRLPPPVQAALRERRLAAGHARALLALPDAAAQEAMALRVEREGMSVREVERLVQKELDAAGPGPLGGRDRGGPRRTAPPRHDDEALVRGFEESLGTPVRLERRRRGGRLVIDFYTDDQLDGLYRRLGGADL